ncbi:MAG TPA: recombinase family protein [Candidatus Saccharimonadales bacterium]|nr:recombinase family protein [Candidatus Saccharimonadales bacterium]
MENKIVGLTAKRIEKAVIYLRVSTEEQVENYSLDTQKEICKKEADKRHYEVAEIFREEGRSAKTADRPELIRMLEYCRKHKKQIDTVIVYRLDRISRQTSDYLAIRKKLTECEITLISASEPTGNSPTEKFVETMLAGFAQMDNDIRSERSRNGMKARFLTGLTNGAVPLGYITLNGYATKDPESWDLMKAAWERMATGTTTLQEMANILTKQGVQEKVRGRLKKLRSQTMSRIFKNKFYTGLIASKTYNQEVKGQHPPMITEELFYQVQAVIEGRNNSKAVLLAKKNPNNPNFPLRRIIKCSICGHSFTGGYSKGKKARFGYYFCPQRCYKGRGSSVPIDDMDQEMIALLGKITLKEKTADLLTAYIRRTYQERAATLITRRADADEELQSLYKIRQTLIEKNLSGIYSDDVFKEQNKRIEEKITTIQITKNDEVLEKYNLERICESITAKFANLAQTYTESSLEQKRVMLCSIFPVGVPWGYPGYSNTQIHDVYTCCLELNSNDVSFGGPYRA